MVRSTSYTPAVVADRGTRAGRDHTLARAIARYVCNDLLLGYTIDGGGADDAIEVRADAFARETISRLRTSDRPPLPADLPARVLRRLSRAQSEGFTGASIVHTLNRR